MGTAIPRSEPTDTGPAPVDIKNLCSRKLLELMQEDRRPDQHRQAIADELLQRRHYLKELQQTIAGGASAPRH